MIRVTLPTGHEILVNIDHIVTVLPPYKQPTGCQLTFLGDPASHHPVQESMHEINVRIQRARNQRRGIG